MYFMVLEQLVILITTLLSTEVRDTKTKEKQIGQVLGTSIDVKHIYFGIVALVCPFIF